MDLVSSKLILFRALIPVMVLLFFFSSIAIAQYPAKLKGECLTLWNEAKSKDTYQAYKKFLLRCEGKRYANVAEIKLKAIKNRCDSAWELYEMTRDRKYLEKYSESCKEYDDIRMEKVQKLLNSEPEQYPILDRIKNIKFDQNILLVVVMLLITALFIRREIRKGRVEEY